MAYVYYPAACEGEVAPHICNSCEEPELGRVRGIAFIDQNVVFTDMSATAEWAAAIALGKIIIIPETSGTFDGGAPKEGQGFGDNEFRTNGSVFTINYKDPNYISNRDFYDTIKDTRIYKIAFITETQVMMSDKVVNIQPKAPIAEDINSEVLWEVTAKWSSKRIPAQADRPAGIFECFFVS